MTDPNFGSGARQGGPVVIERALAPQAGDRGVDVVWFESAAREPLSNLRLGEFAAGEQGETGDVRLVGAVGHQ